MSDEAPAATGFDRVTWPVRSERILLRPITPDDFRRLYETRAIPAMTQWLTAGRRPTRTTSSAKGRRNGSPRRW
jgi:RimJ/RimL family protein N-acetyltransferase